MRHGQMGRAEELARLSSCSLPMKRTLMSIALAIVALISLAAFTMYKGALIGGSRPITPRQYPCPTSMP